MTILKKIGLSKRYGKAIYAISAVLTLAISSLVFFNPYAIPMTILLKLVSIPIILYLYTTFTKKTEIYFYLNLGISRKEYYYIPFVVEFVRFNDEPETDYVMDITDDLFLLRDGYTFPIKCREDLIHHGYILR